MKDRYPTNGASSELKYFDIMPPPEKDIADKVISFRISTFFAVLGAAITITAGAVWGYVDLKSYVRQELVIVKTDVADLKCNMNMVVDVIVYKGQPKQPDC